MHLFKQYVLPNCHFSEMKAKLFLVDFILVHGSLTTLLIAGLIIIVTFPEQSRSKNNMQLRDPGGIACRNTCFQTCGHHTGMHWRSQNGCPNWQDHCCLHWLEMSIQKALLDHLWAAFGSVCSVCQEGPLELLGFLDCSLFSSHSSRIFEII